MAQISLKEQVGGKNKLNPKLAEGRKHRVEISEIENNRISKIKSAAC